MAGKPEKRFIRVAGSSFPVHDTAFGVGVHFRGVHYKAWNLRELDAQVQKAARKSDGFESNRKRWMW